MCSADLDGLDGLDYSVDWSAVAMIDRDTLYRLYVEEGKSINDVVRITDCSMGTVWNYLVEYGIPRRPVGNNGYRLKTYIAYLENLLIEHGIEFKKS